MATDRTEVQHYKIVRAGKDFEIRFYPATTMATVSMPVTTYRELANSGFRKLADYIFGGNAAEMKIAMTSPVHMDINDSVSSMSFVMPSAHNRDNLPLPNDSSVKLSKSQEEYVAVLGFGGYVSDKKIKHYSEKLKDALLASSIPFHGNVRFLGYDPPYRVFGRRNEVIIGVTWRPNE
jgi:hypothetical protein